MKIGISGSQSVGKTTLLNALRSEKSLKEYSFLTEVTRRVQGYGLPINEGGVDLTQKLIMHEHIVNWFMHDKFIADRCSLDGYVYSYYLWSENKVSYEAMSYAKEVNDKLIGKYDILFYIPPEFDIEDDGVRSADVQFRNNIVALFEGNIELLKENNTEVIRIGGSVRERVEQILNKIEQANNEYR